MNDNQDSNPLKDAANAGAGIFGCLSGAGLALLTGPIGLAILVFLLIRSC